MPLSVNSEYLLMNFARCALTIVLGIVDSVTNQRDVVLVPWSLHLVMGDRNT